MKGKNSNIACRDCESYFAHTLKSDAAVYFILVLVVLLSYGYEIFNFNLTIDEEMRASQNGMWFDWVSQGRWGMALLNYILVPNPVVSSTSIFLGVFGSAFGLLAIIKSSFNIDRLGLTVITALAITVPTLSFSFTFSTIAYGVGFGFVALAIANWLTYQKTWPSIVLAGLLASFAMGIYQTFVFVVVMLTIIQVWRLRTMENANVFESIKYPALVLLGGVVFYWLINLGVLNVMHLDIRYVGQFIDIQGFFQNPVTKLTNSFWRCVEIIGLSPIKFGIRSIWLGGVVLAALALTIVYPLYRRSYRILTWMLAISFTMICVVLVADAVAQGGAPLRSVVYIPVGIAIIIACAYTASGKVGKFILISLCSLAIIGNSQVSNHLFASSASAEFRDRMLAETIITEVRRLKPTGSSVLRVEVIGNLMWPITGVQSKTETFGASFFEWDGGNRHRVAAYLSLNGLASAGASEEDRKRVFEQRKAMPVWPHAGWIATMDDILILKLGPYSVPQKTSLCAQGVADLCI